MFDSSLGTSLAPECAHLYMGSFLTLRVYLGLFAAALRCSASVGRVVRMLCCTKFLAESFPTPANLIGTCGCDRLQKVVKSELPAGGQVDNSCCREHPSRRKIDGFCLHLYFCGEGQAAKAFFDLIISSFNFSPAFKTSKQKWVKDGWLPSGVLW